jgi:carbon-monoxide dehydrogenase medium subunit
MIANNFEYVKPGSLSEALGLLSDGSGKVLAGGMSLIPMMKLRLAAPEKLVDVSGLGLDGIAETDQGWLKIGAMATHHQVMSSALVRSKCPLLAETAGNIGDVQVRNMGTIGGSTAHADPAADYPASLMALEASVILAGTGGSTRKVAIGDFLVDALTTALEPGELITEIHVPEEQAGTGVAYQKVVHPASGYAVVGIAVRLRLDAAGKVSFARVGVTGLAAKASRATGVEIALTGGASVEEAAAHVAEGVDATSDSYASAEYRSHLAKVHAARALRVAQGRASK